MGVFCREYTPPLATREALKSTFEASAKLDRMYGVTAKTAAADFRTLQRNPVFYASCHGEIMEGGHARFLSPGGDSFLTTDPDDIEKSYRARFVDPVPAMICFDACHSAYDAGFAKFLSGRGCNIFIGNLFEAAQDGTTAGTPTARELLKALLWSNKDGRHSIHDAIRLGSKAAGTKLDYNTVLYVNSALAPDRDAFDCAAVLVNMNRWLLWLLAVASLLVGAAVGEAWFSA